MEFPAELDLLPQMLSSILEKAKENHLPKKDLGKLELACEEVLVNIIYYAYPGKKGSIEIITKKNGNAFEIHFFDQGEPFNPLEKEVIPPEDIPLEEKKIGGLGIYLFRKLVDEVNYSREEERNHLTLRCFL